MLFIALTETLQMSTSMFEEVTSPTMAYMYTIGYFFVGTMVTILLHHASDYFDKMCGFCSGRRKPTTAQGTEATHETEDSFSVSSEESQRQAHSVHRSVLEKLNGAGWITTITLAIHNFPQGMAIFITIITQFQLGLDIANYLAIHNIAVGLCIAFPMICQTGNRFTALKMSAVAAMAVPMGAFLAYLLLGTFIIENSAVTFGIAHALISGMMTCISLRDFLPAAIKYERNSKGLSFAGFLVGALIISCSLVLTNM